MTQKPVVGIPIARVNNVDEFKARLNGYIGVVKDFLHSYVEDAHFITALLRNSGYRYTQPSNKEGNTTKKTFLRCVYDSFHQTSATPAGLPERDTRGDFPPYEPNINRLLHKEGADVSLTPLKALMWFIFNGEYGEDAPTAAINELELLDLHIPDAAPLAKITVRCQKDTEHNTMQTAILEKYAQMLQTMDTMRINIREQPPAKGSLKRTTNPIEEEFNSPAAQKRRGFHMRRGRSGAPQYDENEDDDEDDDDDVIADPGYF